MNPGSPHWHPAIQCLRTPERRRIVAQVRRKVLKNRDFSAVRESVSRCDDLLTTAGDNGDPAGLYTAHRAPRCLGPWPRHVFVPVKLLTRMSESTADDNRLSFAVEMGSSEDFPREEGFQRWKAPGDGRGVCTPGCLTSEDEERETWTAESLQVSIT